MNEIDELVDRVLIRLISEQFPIHHFTLSAAESCTGGLLGGNLTSRAGASEWYKGGVTTYSNEAKTDILSVSPEILEKHGAVSRETAVAMAKGVRELFGSDVSVSVTGIAGPGGGTPDKPIGTVWMALIDEDSVRAEKQLFEGSRAEIRKASVNFLLNMLVDYLAKC